MNEPVVFGDGIEKTVLTGESTIIPGHDVMIYTDTDLKCWLHFRDKKALEKFAKLLIKEYKEWKA